MKISSAPRTASQLAPVATEETVKNVTAFVVTPHELATELAQSVNEDFDVYLYEDGLAVEFEGNYFTFGETPEAKADLKSFIEFLQGEDSSGELVEGDSCDCDVCSEVKTTGTAYLPSAPFGYDTSYGGDPVSSDPQAAQTDMHGSATVENTTLLVEDLEKQLAVAKSENKALRLAVRTRSTDNEILLEENREFRERIGRQRTTITRYQKESDDNNKNIAELKNTLKRVSEELDDARRQNIDDAKKYALRESELVAELNDLQEQNERVARWRPSRKTYQAWNNELDERVEGLRPQLAYQKQPYFRRKLWLLRDWLNSGPQVPNGGK